MGEKICRKWFQIILVILLLLTSVFSRISLATELDELNLNIIYFYENACGSCNPEEEFIELFNGLVGDNKEGVDVKLLMYNTFHTNGLNLMKEYAQSSEVPKNKQMAPMVLIGDTYLLGENEIQARLKDEFIKAKEALVTNSLELSTIIYFHVTGCGSCAEVEEFLGTLQNTNIEEFNISKLENLDLVKNYFKVYDVPEGEQSVPIVFIGDTYLSGETSIKEDLIGALKNGEGKEALLLIQGEYENKAAEDELSKYEILGILVTGLINGLNPCSISMLLFFLSMIMVEKINLLKIGFAFIAGKFISYFLLGTLFFNLFAKLDIPWFHTTIKIVMVVIVFIIAFFNIRDYFAARKEKYDKIRLQLPMFLRKLNHQWIKKFTSITNGRFLILISFGLGFLISIGEFLCAGQIYLATIVSVLQKSQTYNLQAIIYFLVYGIAFVFPLILLTIFLHKGREIFDVSEWIREKMPMIKLINALVFILFGVAILMWL